MFSKRVTIRRFCARARPLRLCAFHRASGVINPSGAECQRGDWGICEISLFSGDVLMSQRCGRRITSLSKRWRKARRGNQRIITERA
ncbi:hypothetical protein KIF59_07305 [Enterobacter cloacae subsp. cloacae]|nr:hypothetical protein [Enterobacter cloacae subsp. cloacae]